MTSRRTLLRSAGIAALGLTLGGCASTTSAPGSSGKTAAGRVTVYSPAAAQMPTVIQAFNKEHPDIQIQTVRLVGQELASRLQNEAASGQRVADVMLDSTVTAYGPWGDGSTGSDRG